MNRRTALTLRVVIVTSLIWFLVDVFLLMYFADCTSSRDVRSDDCNAKSGGSGTGKPPPPPKQTLAPTPGPVANFFNRIIPEGKTVLLQFHGIVQFCRLMQGVLLSADFVTIHCGEIFCVMTTVLCDLTFAHADHGSNYEKTELHVVKPCVLV